MWTKAQLISAFGTAGLSTGDTVLVHSSLRALGPVQGGAETVIDALLDTLGPEGTLVMPTHTSRVVNATQPVFHERLTPSQVGVLTNVFRLRPQVVRSLHPTHSVAAYGPRARALIAGHERDQTPCSATSPYGRLCDWVGKVLMIGVPLNRCTLFHGCEEWANLPWIHSRGPLQLYSIKADGQIVPVLHHPHWIRTWDQYPRLEPGLLAAGALRLTHGGECPLRVLNARAAADHVTAQLLENPHLILPDPWPEGLATLISSAAPASSSAGPPDS